MIHGSAGDWQLQLSSMMCVLAAEHDLLVPLLPVDYSDLLNSRCTQHNKPQWAASVYRGLNVI